MRKYCHLVCFLHTPCCLFFPFKALSRHNTASGFLKKTLELWVRKLHHEHPFDYAKDLKSIDMGVYLFTCDKIFWANHVQLWPAAERGSICQNTVELALSMLQQSPPSPCCPEHILPMPCCLCPHWGHCRGYSHGSECGFREGDGVPILEAFWFGQNRDRKIQGSPSVQHIQVRCSTAGTPLKGQDSQSQLWSSLW